MDASVFACVETCPRLPGLDSRGTSGGVLLHAADRERLRAALSRAFPSIPYNVLCLQLDSYLATYVSGGAVRLLPDCQREPLLDMLQHLDSCPVPGAGVAGVPAKPKKKRK